MCCCSPFGRWIRGDVTAESGLSKNDAYGRDCLVHSIQTLSDCPGRFDLDTRSQSSSEVKDVAAGDPVHGLVAESFIVKDPSVEPTSAVGELEKADGFPGVLLPLAMYAAFGK